MNFNKTTSLVVLATALMSAGAAHAQGAPQNAEGASQASGGLEEIIVTAQKRAEPLQDVPVAVSAYNSDTLEKARVDNLTGLRGLVPGLTITRSGAAVDVPQISLRGISIQDVLPSVEAGIGFSVDGVPIAFQRGALMDSFDLERLEVLRGPQGVLAGKNTTGGTINVIRTRPDPDADGAHGKVRFTGGSYGENDYEGVVTAPVVPGLLAVKAAVTVKKNDGQFKNILTGSREGDRDLRDYNLALVANPTDKASVYVAFQRMENDSRISPYIPVHTPNVIPYPIPGYVGGADWTCSNPFMSIVCGPVDKERNGVETTQQPASLHLNAVTGEASYDLGWGRVVSVTGFREFKEVQVSDFDATRFGLFRDPATLDGRQFSEEARFESAFDGPLNFVVGAFYMKYKYTEMQNPSLDLAGLPATAVGFPVDIVPPGQFYLNSLNGYITDQDNRSMALFFQADYDLTEKFSVTLGARQTWDKKETRFRLYAPIFDTVRTLDVFGPLAGDVSNDVKFKKFTPKASVQYKFNRDLLTYATYSRGYNTGGFSGRSGSLLIAVQPYDPEVMDSFEIGMKSEFLDRRVRLNLSAYHNTLKDKQENVLTIAGTSNTTATLNVAKAQYKGVEVELSVVPLDGWTITSSLGYLDAKYKDFEANLGQGFADLTDLKLRRTPKWTAGAISDYVFDAGPGQIGLNAAVYYTSRYETDVLNDPRASIPPVAKVDLGVRYMFDLTTGTELELGGFVKNVTDDTTYDGFTSGGGVGSFIDFANPTVGRTWGASLTARF